LLKKLTYYHGLILAGGCLNLWNISGLIKYPPLREILLQNPGNLCPGVTFSVRIHINDYISAFGKNLGI